ncbi:MAG: inositol monophosphatase family protein [Kouleothrix sp.]
MSDATLEFAITLARQAGQLLRDGLSQQRQIDLKSPYELVTDIDRASEALIVAAIRARFPGHAILAEEGGGEYAAARPTWLIDPLDGTNNFAHGFPFFAVSLALWAEQRPLLGVIYDPLRDELFAAQAGAGAHCNDRRMHVSGVATLGAALVSTGFAYDYAERADNNLGQFDRVQARCQGVRRAGAAALDLAYLAMGRLDAHWEIDLKPWDTGAAALLVTEAGGRISDGEGRAWQPWCESIVASNGLIHDELLGVLSYTL